MDNLIDEELLKEIPPDQLVEEGLGLIARGLYRMGDIQKNPLEAANLGFSVISVIREMSFNYKKVAERKPE